MRSIDEHPAKPYSSHHSHNNTHLRHPYTTETHTRHSNGSGSLEELTQQLLTFPIPVPANLIKNTAHAIHNAIANNYLSNTAVAQWLRSSVLAADVEHVLQVFYVVDCITR